MMLVTGGSGRLGSALRHEFRSARFPTRQELDIRDATSISNWLEREPPDVVIHAAALTNVRQAQEDQAACWDINVAGTQRLVNVLRKVAPDCYFVYVSSACVFQGDRGNYDETSIPWPKNVYGLSKLVGEYMAQQMPSHLIVRTNFAARGEWPYPRAFSDRFGTYLFADDVARAIHQLVDERVQGVVHVAGDRRLSMLELARMTTPHVEPMTMAECDLPLTVDMTLRSCRIPAFPITT